MTFKDYDDYVSGLKLSPDGWDINVITLGLCGESGEVAEKVKKINRDPTGEVSHAQKWGIMLELGDVLWYITALATQLGFSLEDIALYNVKKLNERYNR